jgi:3-hydroxyacyl-[acyl-carrier-protein] dehydratase
MQWSWVNELRSCVPGSRAEATMTFAEDMFFFSDHSPGDPKVPGVIQVEMIAQTAGMCIRAARADTTTVLARIVNAKFIDAIRPREICRVEARLSRLGSESATVEGAIFVGENKRCSAELRIALVAGGAGYPCMDAILYKWREQRGSGTS